MPVECAPLTKKKKNRPLTFYLDLEAEVLLHVLYDHDEEGQLDAQRHLGIGRTRDERGGHVRAGHLQHQRLHLVVDYATDVAVLNLRPN